MIHKVCIKCGSPFGQINKRGNKCGACIRKRTMEFDTLPLRDLTSPAQKSRTEIQEAKMLLTNMGYDIQGDVHIQFIERARSRYNVTF